MNAFSKIDMGEVTRLTQAGKLSEAMALLQGHTASKISLGSISSLVPHSTHKVNRPSSPLPTIDMVAPTTPDGAWTAPTQFKQRTALPAFKAERAPDLAQMMQAFRGLPKLGSLSSVGAGLGTARQAPVRVPEGARFEERTFSNNAGSRTYKVYVPSGYSGQSLPVVVMLHGCTQNPDDFAAGTRMNEVAEEQTFLVAYPRQPQSANMQKCWNWFNPGDQQRGSGEPSLIAGIAMQVVEEFSADPARVYVAGLSAGGAAAAIMADTYPDVFAAVGVHSGLACGAARDMPSAFAAMGGGGTIRQRGQGRMVPTIVFHGDADRTVNPCNSDHVVAQAGQHADLTKTVTHGETTGGMGYTRTVQLDAAGGEVLEQWVLRGAGHAWSGGSASGSYTDARGPDASREMIRFFLANPSGTAATKHWFGTGVRGPSRAGRCVSST
jgi:poly(hydroxyalkanoate) depolymerase family esterase